MSHHGPPMILHRQRPEPVEVKASDRTVQHLLQLLQLLYGHQPENLPLPPGKLNVRFRYLRGLYQVFAGRFYILGASGDTPTEAVARLLQQYDVPTEAEITMHR